MNDLLCLWAAMDMDFQNACVEHCAWCVDAHDPLANDYGDVLTDASMAYIAGGEL